MAIHTVLIGNLSISRPVAICVKAAMLIANATMPATPSPDEAMSPSPSSNSLGSAMVLVWNTRPTRRAAMPRMPITRHMAWRASGDVAIAAIIFSFFGPVTLSSDGQERAAATYITPVSSATAPGI